MPRFHRVTGKSQGERAKNKHVPIFSRLSSRVPVHTNSGVTHSGRRTLRGAPAAPVHNNDDSSVAIPRNDMNPATSVTVVKMIDDDCAGSWPSRVSAIGISEPAMLAITIDATIEITITSARPVLRLQTSTPSPVVAAIAKPLTRPTLVSLNNTRNQCRVEISRSARPRITTASDCAPVLPDWPAPTGIRTAHAEQ